MSYVYLQSEPGLWTVGFYGPDDRWVAESDYEDRNLAAMRCSVLNGATPPDSITVDGIRVTPAYVRLFRGMNDLLHVRLQAAGDAIEVGTRLAQELREFVDTAAECGSRLESVRVLLAEWDIAFEEWGVANMKRRQDT